MGISGLMTKTMINSSSSIKMAQIQQSAKQQMKGEAAELESEMKLDKVADPAKIKKVEELGEKVDKVDKWQKEGLTELNENLNKAAKEEIEIQRQEKAEEKKKAEKAAEKKKAEAKEQEARTEKSEQADAEKALEEKQAAKAKELAEQQNLIFSKGKDASEVISSIKTGKATVISESDIELLDTKSIMTNVGSNIDIVL